MINEIIHVGVSVSDLDRSVDFYKNVLGLEYTGELLMEGKETDILFGRKGARARVAYLNGSDNIKCPPVELIQFTDTEVKKAPTDLFTTSIAEICFVTDDIWGEYRRLTDLGVRFLSEPQNFDFTGDGFGKSIAVYLTDPDGIILELIENI